MRPPALSHCVRTRLVRGRGAAAREFPLLSGCDSQHRLDREQIAMAALADESRIIGSSGGHISRTQLAAAMRAAQASRELDYTAAGEGEARRRLRRLLIGRKGLIC